MSTLKTEIVALINNVFGPETASTFDDYYDSNDLYDIKNAAIQMFTNFFGKELGMKKLNPIFKKYKLASN